MIDKLFAIALQLMDKHLILASVLIGVLSLYILGFNADKLIQTQYALLAFIIIDIFIRIASYINISLKIDSNKKGISQANTMTTKLENILDITESLATVHVNIVSNINALNSSILKLCDMMKGIPNKPQLRLFISMRTKLYLMEIIEQCISYIYSNSLVDTYMSMTSVNRRKINLDLHKRKDIYYNEIQIYLNPNIVLNAKKELDNIIDSYINEIIDLMDSNVANVEKMYTLMIINTTTEEQLLKIWCMHISNLTDGVNILTIDDMK
ncbi:MAG: hypothetical protein PHW93_07300 [Candidatus Methanomethylophilaceae archaeon]|nr:hypothetical protein [Candidatus Methanomethylophilaceae archaeon]